MNIISSGTLREIAKFLVDASKITATAAFITPWFSNKEISNNVIVPMAIAALSTFILGILFHRITDHLEGKD